MMEGRCAANTDVGMGCASPYAYETALRLLEIEEEIAGACLPRQSSQVCLLSLSVIQHIVHELKLLLCITLPTRKGEGTLAPHCPAHVASSKGVGLIVEWGHTGMCNQ